MENKEVVKKIMDYLAKQPNEVVYRLCANLMLDIRRWDIFHTDLPSDEADSLISRSYHNSRTLERFLQDEDQDQNPLTLGELESEV